MSMSTATLAILTLMTMGTQATLTPRCVLLFLAGL
jgi:hypothetical protein